MKEWMVTAEGVFILYSLVDWTPVYKTAPYLVPGNIITTDWFLLDMILSGDPGIRITSL